MGRGKRAWIDFLWKAVHGCAKEGEEVKDLKEQERRRRKAGRLGMRCRKPTHRLHSGQALKVGH
jgi:hypothetical protein